MIEVIIYVIAGITIYSIIGIVMVALCERFNYWPQPLDDKRGLLVVMWPLIAGVLVIVAISIPGKALYQIVLGKKI